MAAMEGLPGDALLMILLKLAAQDPLSLLRATFACKWILEKTEKNVAIWKEAFFAPYREDNGEIRSEDMAGLDAKIASPGVYKKLALARARQAAKPGESRTNPKGKRFGFGQIKKRLLLQGKKIFGSRDAETPTRSVKIYAPRFLDIFMLRGRLFYDIRSLPEEQLCHEGDPEDLSNDSDVYCLDFKLTEFGQKLLGATYGEMIEDWEKVTPDADGRRLVEDRISIETFAYVTIEGQVSAVTCRPIIHKGTLTCKDCKGFEYQFPECRVPVYLVPNGTNGFSGKGGLIEDPFSTEAGQKVIHTSL